MAASGPISRFLAARRRDRAASTCRRLTSLLSIVVAVAFFAGIAYAFVAIPAQTQLQEDLPEDVRGRVFGVLNMLVSVASFLPILIVGPIADLIGTTPSSVVVAIGVVARRGRLDLHPRPPQAGETTRTRHDVRARDPIAAALGADRPRCADATMRRRASAEADDRAARRPCCRRADRAAAVAATGGVPDAPTGARPTDPTDRA